ncbi:hypothetical protein BC833DRAFT_594562 [Globomyces pollinis-pini]|nr:hypothetical protein BC833DRAFT_594562 [Globomyces pollinis-pini]
MIPLRLHRRYLTTNGNSILQFIQFNPKFDGLKDKILKDLMIIPNFVDSTTQSILVKEADKKLKRTWGKVYEENHFDSVIQGYRECIASDWAEDVGQEFANAKTQPIIKNAANQVRERLGMPNLTFSPPHILDLRDGQSGIRPHVDHLKAFGSIISGICLISPCVIVFKDKNTNEECFRLLLEANCLYAQKDFVRFNFTHEIPMTEDDNHSFRGKHIIRNRRITVMLRDNLVQFQK